MTMKIKLIIYVPGHRNYGFYSLHFGYTILYIIDRTSEINVD